MSELIERIAKVKSTTLGYEDHGILTSMLHLDYGSSGQGAGGYDLRYYGVEFIARTLRACVSQWEDIAGRTIIALTEGHNGLVRGIKPLPTEQGETFIFEDLKRAD